MPLKNLRSHDFEKVPYKTAFKYCFLWCLLINCFSYLPKYQSTLCVKKSRWWFRSSNVQKHICLFSGVLCTGSLVNFTKHVTNFRIRPGFWMYCKLRHFLVHTFMYYSSSILAIMGVEKFVALFYPIHAKRICNIKRGKNDLLGMVAFLLIVVNFYLIILAKVGKTRLGECTFGYYGSLLMSYFDFAFYSFGPFVVMCSANTLIVSKLVILKFRSANQSNLPLNQGLSKSALRGALMLVSVSLTFIILTTPVCLFIFNLIPSSKSMETVVFVMATLNHSINGFLYCLFGSKFRKELFKLICRCKQQQSRGFNQWKQHGNKYRCILGIKYFSVIEIYLLCIKQPGTERVNVLSTSINYFYIQKQTY